MKNQKEFWRNINGYNGKYQVSSFGRIRSYYGKTPIILKPRKNNRGYKYVNLSRNKKSTSKTVHRIVAIEFLKHNNILSDYTVDHINGNKNNNCVSNLRWISRKENFELAKQSNLLARGIKNGNTKLSPLQVRLIRYKNKKGKSECQIEREVGVGRFDIHKIINRTYWKHI